MMEKTRNEQILKRLSKIKKEREALLEEYSNSYFDIFDKCHHFVVVSGIVEQRFEKNDIYYGCIKCGLDERAGDYDMYDFQHNPMKAYFKKCKCYEFSVGMRRKLNNDGNLDFHMLKEACARIMSQKPDISNDELENELNKLFNISKKDVARVKHRKFSEVTKDPEFKINRSELFW